MAQQLANNRRGRTGYNSFLFWLLGGPDLTRDAHHFGQPAGSARDVAGMFIDAVRRSPSIERAVRHHVPSFQASLEYKWLGRKVSDKHMLWKESVGRFVVMLGRKLAYSAASSEGILTPAEPFRDIQYRDLRYCLRLAQCINEIAFPSEVSSQLVSKREHRDAVLEKLIILRKLDSLDAAVHGCDVNAVRNLLKDGADPDSADCVGSGEYVLLNAAGTAMSSIELEYDEQSARDAARRCTEIVHLLLTAGANAHIRDQDGWHALLRAGGHGTIQMIDELCDTGIDVNSPDNEGWTALMQACRYNRPQLAERLIGRGADRNASDKDGWTPKKIVEKFNSNGFSTLRLNEEAPEKQQSACVGGKDSSQFRSWLSEELHVYRPARIPPTNLNTAFVHICASYAKKFEVEAISEVKHFIWARLVEQR